MRKFLQVALRQAQGDSSQVRRKGWKFFQMGLRTLDEVVTIFLK